MTRKECEKKLLDIMEQAYQLYKEHNPDGNHLSMFASDNGCCVWGYTKDNADTTMDCYKSPYGDYRLTKEAIA